MEITSVYRAFSVQTCFVNAYGELSCEYLSVDPGRFTHSFLSIATDCGFSNCSGRCVAVSSPSSVFAGTSQVLFRL